MNNGVNKKNNDDGDKSSTLWASCETQSEFSLTNSNKYYYSGQLNKKKNDL